jgi:hypothetical protein
MGKTRCIGLSDNAVDEKRDVDFELWRRIERELSVDCTGCPQPNGEALRQGVWSPWVIRWHCRRPGNYDPDMPYGLRIYIESIERAL